MSNNQQPDTILLEKINLLEEKLKRKSREVDELKSAFLGNVSHEIRTPMNAIMGFSSLLQDSELTDEDRDMFVDGIMKSSKNLLNVVDDIMEAAKLAVNEVNMELREFEVSSLLEDLYHNYIEQLKDGVVLKFTCSPIDMRIIADLVKIKLLLSKLLEHAVKNTERGFIEFGCQQYSRDKLEFYIQDTGKGIAPDNKDRVLKDFSQLATRKHPGAGLGLILAEKLSKVLGGELTMNSTSEPGTTFTLIIPVRFVMEPKQTDYRLVEKHIPISEIYNRSASTCLKKNERAFSVRSKYNTYRA